MATLKNKAAVIAALRKQGKAKLALFSNGLIKAGEYVQAESQKIVPVDYGPLKASAFTRISGKNTAKPKVTVGYTAAYAVYVHENLDAAHGAAFNAKHAAELAYAKKHKIKHGPYRHARGTNQTAKFLEIPFRRAQVAGSLNAIVAEEMLK